MAGLVKENRGISAEKSRTETDINEADTSADTMTIVQCEKCQSILGRTSSCVICFDDKLGSITLKRDLTSLEIVTDAQIERYKGDIYELHDSLFQKLKCYQCHQQIGMVLQNLPMNFALMEKEITLFADSINCFNINPNNKESLCMIQCMAKMQKDMLKIQSVLLNFNDRLKRMEACLSDHTSTCPSHGNRHADNVEIN